MGGKDYGETIHERSFAASAGRRGGWSEGQEGEEGEDEGWVQSVQSSAVQGCAFVPAGETHTPLTLLGGRSRAQHRGRLAGGWTHQLRR